jgi:PiT family inorganic phosphate transporter
MTICPSWCEDAKMLREAIVGSIVSGFVLLTGSNDGGTLVAAGLGTRPLLPITAVVILATCVSAVPIVLGTRVATTLADRLVPFGEAQGRTALACAVAASILVVLLLSRLRLPTSLTLALVGGIAGAGLGAGLEVSWAATGLVLMLAAAAPLVGAGLAATAIALVRRAGDRGPAARRLSLGHVLGFVASSIAYGANDGQKMFAVAAVMVSSPADPVRVGPAASLAIALGFAVGTLLGLRRHAPTVARGVLPVRPLQVVVAEMSTATAVIATGLVGAPVSATQTSLGALVGAGAAEGMRRVRWRMASQVGLAWMLTMPAAFAVGGALGWAAT